MDAIKEAVKAILINSVEEALDVEVEYGVRQVEHAVDKREDELAALKEENERLREALETIAGIRGVTDAWRMCAEMARIARGALAE